ncbi:S-adenosyl-L-methionine-dependent methyltransferase [Mytilinidion resinicola]|uniref:S-adenosyl-L-methionine-dependent methyltransferase n=1 Tax=Mytilinidion resinicola TaxID=574789 RepID=A0A6A6Y8Z6_9PEZI|nr:S-adenosyl-L-methionine-dependent methyltransferase [Mytilinidion resinicola]KAF2805109.1 S-adenosyl-L-methionine-dependent methyltransferase [Mytilinidion resinicola]
MQAVHRYQIAAYIDSHETIPFEELSKRSGLNLVDLRRILRLVMTRRVFCEPRPDHVAHTAASWLLVEDSRVRDLSGIICDERFPASARVVDALMMYGQPQSPAESGFSLANQTKRGLYEELKHFPARQARWTLAMSAMAQKIDFDYILENFPLRSNETATVVDVGGGNGTISLGLARRLPNATFLVQDAPDVIHDAKVPEDLQSRIMYQAYNFFQPQPVSGARVYYFRNVFHNWPDDTCVQILKNHVGIMEGHTILVIDDFALHEPLTVSPYEERRRRNMDITMLTYFGSRERTIREWGKLLAMADVRFRLQGVAQHGKQPNTILEVGWSV